MIYRYDHIVVVATTPSTSTPEKHEFDSHQRHAVFGVLWRKVQNHDVVKNKNDEDNSNDGGNDERWRAVVARKPIREKHKRQVTGEGGGNDPS